jgi:putative peptidoglycan lipid II flippase
VQLPSLKRLSYRFRPDFRWRDAGVKAILLLMGPAVIAASTTQINVLINSMFASRLEDGAIFWLAAAFRLVQLPLGLFGVALGTVTLPLLSRLVVAGKLDAFRSELARAIRLALLLTIPCTVGLMMLAEPIISLLYQHGKFTAYEAAQSAAALRYYAIGLAGYAALKVLVNAFYALDRRKTPMMVSFLAVALNLLLNWVFTVRLGWGHRGLAFSTGCIATVNFLLLYLLMQAQLEGLETRRLLVLLAKIAGASAALMAICAASSQWLLAHWQTQAFLPKLAALSATVIVGAVVFAGCGVLLHIEELKELRDALRRRLAR